MMNRRDFLKNAGLGAAVLGATACNNAKSDAAIHAESNAEPHGTMARHYPEVGLLGYGCMRWKMIKGEDGKEVIDQEDVNRLVDYAIEHGVNYFDSAPVYLKGQSEEATAKALLRHPREDYLIATKCSSFGASGEGAFRMGFDMYQKSLEYYKTDHLDYYLLHSLSGLKAFNERFGDCGLVDYLVKEREQGHIRNLGFSFHGTREGFDELLALHDKYHWDFVQIQANYVDWNEDAEYLYNELDRREIPVVIMEPLLGGGLSNVPAKIAEELKSRDPQASVASWAFRFIGSYPRVLTVLSGMTYMEHLQDNLRTYLDFKPLNQEEVSFLTSMGRKIKEYPLIGCTACQYCMPCEYGIDIPGIFRFYNDRVNEETYVTGPEQKHYARLRRQYLLKYNKAIPTVRQADHCINCRKCMPRCPQRIRIPDMLHNIDEYLEKLKQETF